jgi:DNA-binding CsgD family transcriptional regulator
VEQLRRSDLAAVLRCIREVSALADLDTFPHRILASLRRLVPADFVSFTQVQRLGRRVVYHGEPRDWPSPPEALQAYRAHLHEHPMVTHYWRTGDTVPLRFSDFLTRRQLHDLALWRECYAPRGLEHQLACVLGQFSRRGIGLGFNRAPDVSDFSERDRLILAHLQPHLVQAYENAAAVSRMAGEGELLRAAVEALGAGVVLLGPGGRVGPLSEAVRRRLEAYFDGPLRWDRLPEELARWAEQAAGAARNPDELPRLLSPLVKERTGRRLVIRRLETPDGAVLVLEEQRTAVEPDTVGTLGFTPRETEVVTWVLEGKTNPEIATILGMRRRTVAKHLERIYAKLGVEGRTAAMRRLLAPG